MVFAPGVSRKIYALLFSQFSKFVPESLTRHPSRTFFSCGVHELLCDSSEIWIGRCVSCHRKALLQEIRTQGSHDVLRTMDKMTCFLAICNSHPVFLAKPLTCPSQSWPLQIEARVWENLQHPMLLLDNRTFKMRVDHHIHWPNIGHIGMPR